MKFKHAALAVAALAIAGAVEPPDSILPSQWLPKNFTLPDGEQAGDLIDLTETPHLIEPLDAMGPDAPDNEVAVMKSAQSAFTVGVLLGSVAHSIDCDACDMMVVQPTDGALTDFISKKLNRVLEADGPLKKKVASQTSRSGKASTTYEKKYGNYSLTLAIANSAADLRSKTVKKAYCDEVDEYPDDLNDQGDPIGMIEARQTQFLVAGTWKRLYISTPTLKGGSRIEQLYEAGDQRRWHVKCPHCSDRFVFEFDRKHFQFNDTYPYEARYFPPCCGGAIEGWQKKAVYKTGIWIATAPGPGKYKSYHFDALSSPFVPWDEIAKKFIRAGDDPAKLKTFYNLDLGLPYELKTDTPDHTRLMERREDLVRRQIPPWGLILTAAADVQMRGIYYEIVAHGPDKQTWVVDADFLLGDTDDPERGAFAELTKVYEREYPDAFGGKRRVDAFGVDSGYRSNIVYTWCRNRVGAMALKGVDGWSKPAIGSPTLQDIDFAGRKIKKGATLWNVGTWPLKASFYSNLRKEGLKAGAEADPPGYCHFGTWLDEVYFRQITAEYLAEDKVRGRTIRKWKEKFGEENHWLDCRIYNYALADYLGMSRMTPDDWAVLAKERGVTDEARLPDLLAPRPMQQAAATPAPKRAPPPSEDDEPAPPAPSDDWLGGYTFDF